MKRWLMKTEPDTFSFDELVHSPFRTAMWDGVRNYQARNFMRDQKLTDQVFIYHSSCKIPAIVGIARIVKEGYPDPTAMDPNHSGFDEKAAKKGLNPWVAVDIAACQRAREPIPLTTLRGLKELETMVLVNPGRLSVQPVTLKEWQFILGLTEWLSPDEEGYSCLE